MDLDALVAPIRKDVHGGAAEVTRHAIAAFEAALPSSAAHDADALRSDLAGLAEQIVAAQPAMASLVALAAAVLRAASGTASVDAARREVAEGLTAFRQRLGEAARQVAERAEGLVPVGGRVLTVSASSTVRAALLEAAKRRAFDVLCLEGRPNCEGRRLAAALADAGVSVTVAVDAAVAALIRGCDLVLVGADSIGDLGVVNKIGTRPAAWAARSAGVPIYALADTSKLLPTGYTHSIDGARPRTEVWPGAPVDIRLWNQYFEPTPLSLFSGIVTELGLRSPEELEQRRAELSLPAALYRSTEK